MDPCSNEITPEVVPMDCVLCLRFTASASILVNGSPSKPLKHHRGLR